MDFFNLPILKMLSTRMAYAGERQAVLAQNIANIDTPGYTPRDMAPLEFKDLLVGGASRMPMAATQPAHITKPGGFTTTFDVVRNTQAFETKPIKNKVNLEEQMMLMSGNQGDFNLASQVYRKMTGLFRTALGANNG